MGQGVLSETGPSRLHEVLSGYIEGGEVPGLTALVACGDDVHVEVLGTPALDDPAPLQRDAIFRIASLTKPIAAAGAMALVDDGVLSLQDQVETYLPELADRRVLRRLDAPLDDIVPAERSITLEDLPPTPKPGPAMPCANSIPSLMMARSRKSLAGCIFSFRSPRWA